MAFDMEEEYKAYVESQTVNNEETSVDNAGAAGTSTGQSSAQ